MKILFIFVALFENRLPSVKYNTRKPGNKTLYVQHKILNVENHILDVYYKHRIY